MRTLQEQYNAIKNGNGNKAQFLKQARHLFPQYVNQYSDFDTAAGVLKSKQIISEAAGGVVGKGFDIWDWKKILAEEVKAEEKETSKEVLDAQAHAYDNKDMKNADNVNFNEIMKGFYCEMKDEKNKDKTGDELKAIVVKNLAKDPLYYTKNGEFGTKGVGYTTEAPGLGEPKEPKGKHKSSGYGDLDTKTEKVKANVQDSLGDKEAKTSNPSKVKEMPVTPQNSAGVKKMPMPGSEKTMKLQENKETNDEKIERYEKYTYILNGKEVKPDEIAFYDHLLGAEIDGKLYKLGIPKDGKVELREDIGMFNDPIGYKKSEPNPKDEIFTKKYKGNGVYVIYKNGEEVKTIEGEGNANAWINDEMRKLKEADKSSIASDPEGLKKNNLGTLRQLLDYAEKQDSSEVGKLQSKIWNLLSDEQKDNLISKYAKDPDQYFEMDWDSLPDEISTNIARDKEFKGQTQTEQKLRSLIQQIIKEEISKVLNENNSEDPTYIAQQIAGEFDKDIIPGSEKFTYGPDEDGTYHLEFQLGFDSLDSYTPEEFEQELEDQIGGSSSGGPGQSFSRTYVSYEGEKNGNHIFGVNSRGGYDI